MSKYKSYIGDGVYADFDGYGIVLTTEDGISVPLGVMESAGIPRCPRSPHRIAPGPKSRRKDIMPRSKLSPYRELMLEAERQVLGRAITDHHGNLAATARYLGIARTTLWRRMTRLGLVPQDYRHHQGCRCAECIPQTCSPEVPT